MENKIKRYLDRVVIEIVKDTMLDYENKKIHYPISNYSSWSCFIRFNHLHSYPFAPFSFSDYCENQFGLTDEEIQYVWKEYKSIILDKIKTGRSLPS